MLKTERLVDKLDKVLLKDQAFLLAEENLDTDSLKEVIDDCFLIKTDTDKFLFSFMGKNIIEAFGNKFFSKDINDLVLPSNHVISEDLKKVIRSKKPMESAGEFFNEDGMKIKYRKKIYPLTDISGGVDVKYIFGGMRWKTEY